MKYEIYSKGTIIGRNPGKGAYCGYVIELNEKGNNEKELGKIIGKIGLENEKCSYKKAEIIALSKTLQYFIDIVKYVDLKTDITIYCGEESIVLALKMRWYEYWISNNWIGKNKKPVINKKEWKELFSKIKFLKEAGCAIDILPYKYNNKIDYLDIAKINAKKYVQNMVVDI